MKGRPAVRALEVSILAVVATIVWRVGTGTPSIAAGPFTISLLTLYNPVLILVALIALRAWLQWRPVLRRDASAGELAGLVRLGSIAVGVTVVLVLPVIIGIAARAATGQLPGTEILWRSSPRGVDALAYLVPNPTHPWFGAATHPWLLPPVADAYPEYVASFSLAALVVIAIAAWRRALPRMWVAFTAIFVLLSLGPFVHVAGVNTYVPGPWAVLRYVPVVGMARSPSRFAMVAVLGLSLLFGFAVSALFRGPGRWRRAAAAALAGVLAFELLPAPRPLFSAAVPEVYRVIAENGEESGRLLELPTGIRDGTSSAGNFSAGSQFFQTRHNRPLIGGYLSRVSKARKRKHARDPMMRALLTLSEGRELSGKRRDAAFAASPQFLRDSCVKFVLVDKRRAPPGLREFAVDALRLRRTYEDGDYVVLTPLHPPPCAPRKGTK